MEYDALVNAVGSCVSLGLLIYLGWWVYPAHRVDAFRQDLFAVRDELFDVALDEAISFDHPAYLAFRDTLNKMVRFGHRSTAPQLVVLVLFYSEELAADDGKNALREELETHLRDVEPAVAALIWSLYERYRMAVLTQLAIGSLTFVLFVVPVVLVFGALSALVHHGWGHMKTLAKHWHRRAEVAAQHA